MKNVEYILTAKEMQQYDRNTIEAFKIPGIVLMEQAALSVLEEIKLLLPKAESRILVLAGMGNNGGDALAVARLLYLEGYDVTVLPVSNKLPEEICFTGEAAVQYDIIKNMEIPIVNQLPSDSYDMIIDGIFGVGLNRKLEGKIYDIIDQINQYGGIKLAIDIPSGLDATTGKIHGICFMADVTLTFAFLKRGLFLQEGKQVSGKVVKKRIGITPLSFLGKAPAMTALNGSISEYLPQRKPNGHKGTFGKILVVAGSKENGGAAYLAAKAAFYAGCGMVRICIHKEQYQAVFSKLPEAIYDCYSDVQAAIKAVNAGMEWADVIILGPGMGQNDISHSLWKEVIRGPKLPLIIDADGLNILSWEENSLLLHRLQAEEESRRTLVLTPHPLELSRLTKKNVKELKENRESILEEYSLYMKAIIVKKDAATVIYHNDGRMSMNLSGNHGMATAGSGDVLCGILAAFLSVFADPYEAVVTAVYCHGKSGDYMMEKKGFHSLMAGDLIIGICHLLKEDK